MLNNTNFKKLNIKPDNMNNKIYIDENNNLTCDSRLVKNENKINEKLLKFNK